MASFMDFLFGQGEKTQQFQRFTPDQQGVLDQVLGGAQQQLPQAFQFLQSILGGDPEAMNQFEAPARRSFQEETLPSIAERFTGSLSGQRSSAFGQQLGQAGAGLEEGLSAQRGQMGFQALQQLQQLLSQGTQSRFDTAFRPATGGFLGGAAGGLGQGLGALLPMLFGGR